MTETTIDRPSMVLPVDPEHNALRFSVIAILVASCVLGFILFSAIIPGESINFIAGILAFAAAVGITWMSERFLKSRWPSGRTVAILDNIIQIRSKDAVQQEIDASKHVNTLFWRFKIKRGSRMRGWFVIACALEQESNYLAVYTFMSPERANAPEIANRFKMLLPNKDSDKDLRLAGEQRRLRAAEEHRWMQGAEMNMTDFETFIAALQRQFPRWMSNS
jgi:hypothetical protein